MTGGGGAANPGSGRRFEVRVANYLRGEGYVVIKSGGSLGCADLVALKIGEILLVQAKGGAKPISHDGWNDLYDTARMIGATAVVVDRPVLGRLRWRRIVGRHVARTHTWPAVEFVTDRAEVAAALTRYRAGREAVR